MTTTEPLTEREQQALEQMREAQEQGSTLKDYAAKIGLDVHRLYELRRRLVRKGAFEPLPRRKARKSGEASAFDPAVRSALVLRIRRKMAPEVRSEAVSDSWRGVRWHSVRNLCDTNVRILTRNYVRAARASLVDTRDVAIGQWRREPAWLAGLRR